ncbi:hypothetical protein EVA_03595 [gut metagenome]|uniref:Uncharacterized protein n=1 Tax=gut metagenome TaxID=749906 RepID=J9GYL1_9ZZZZ
MRLVQDELDAQKMLEPYVANVRHRQVELREMLAVSASQPKPQSVSETLVVLNKMAAEVGIPNMQFVPDATSVVGRSDIRLVGRGDGASDNFRRFVLALSDQPWVVKIEEVKGFSNEELHSFELTLRASYGKKGGE